MSTKPKILKIGFDFDGVIVDKPPFIPKKLIERLFKGNKPGLAYRFPKSKLEQHIRKLSHRYFLRPALEQNLALIKKLREKNGIQLFLVSSRYSFLEEETRTWINNSTLSTVFNEIHLNLKDKQPHLFKKATCTKLNLNHYFEDDPLLVDFLRKEVAGMQVAHVTEDGDANLKALVNSI